MRVILTCVDERFKGLKTSANAYTNRRFAETSPRLSRHVGAGATHITTHTLIAQRLTLCALGDAGREVLTGLFTQLNRVKEALLADGREGASLWVARLRLNKEIYIRREHLIGAARLAVDVGEGYEGDLTIGHLLITDLA